jgi:hypothetical protein
MTDNIDRIQAKINSATSELLEDLIDQNARTAQTIGVVLASSQELTAIMESLVIKMHEFELKTQLYDTTAVQQLSIIKAIEELHDRHCELCDYLVQVGVIADDQFEAILSSNSRFQPERSQPDSDNSELPLCF